MNDFMSFLPLLFMTAFFFFINMWIGKRCKVWTTSVIILSLIPFINYFGTLLVFIKAIESLSKRIEDLEKNKTN
jgi:hypothetical protein